MNVHRNRLHGRRSIRGGFTLVELLVVIGIIAVLIAILLPSLQKARIQAQRVACQANLRQVMTAVFAYQAENGGRFVYQNSRGALVPDPFNNAVTRPNWFESVTRFMKMGGREQTGVFEALLCPTVRASDPSDPARKNSYVANGWMCHFAVKTTKEAATVVAFTCQRRLHADSVVRPHAPSNLNPPNTTLKTSRWSGWMRVGNGELETNRPHDGGTNVVFADGHSEYRKWQDLTSRDFGLLINGQDIHEPNVNGYDNTARLGRVFWR